MPRPTPRHPMRCGDRCAVQRGGRSGGSPRCRTSPRTQTLRAGIAPSSTAEADGILALARPQCLPRCGLVARSAPASDLGRLHRRRRVGSAAPAPARRGVRSTPSKSRSFRPRKVEGPVLGLGASWHRAPLRGRFRGSRWPLLFRVAKGAGWHRERAYRCTRALTRLHLCPIVSIEAIARRRYPSPTSGSTPQRASPPSHPRQGRNPGAHRRRAFELDRRRCFRAPSCRCT